MMAGYMRTCGSFPDSQSTIEVSLTPIAASLYDKACGLNESRGCTLLGKQYEDGLGVVRDVSKAVALYPRGCDNGDAAGCEKLGEKYQKGEGVPMDLQAALAAYQRGLALAPDKVTLQSLQSDVDSTSANIARRHSKIGP
jgi:TPR repeat protein